MNIEAAVTQVKQTVRNTAAVVALPSGLIMVHIPANNGAGTTPLANFHIDSVQIVKDRVLSHGMEPADYLVVVYRAKRGAFKN